MPVDVDAGPALADGPDLDLIDALLDVAGRVGVRHVAGNHRQTLLGRIDARQRGGQRLGKAHG